MKQDVESTKEESYSRKRSKAFHLDFDENLEKVGLLESG